jgi:hypothetical protein
MMNVHFVALRNFTSLLQDTVTLDYGHYGNVYFAIVHSMLIEQPMPVVVKMMKLRDLIDSGEKQLTIVIEYVKSALKVMHNLFLGLFIKNVYFCKNFCFTAEVGIRTLF